MLLCIVSCLAAVIEVMNVKIQQLQPGQQSSQAGTAKAQWEQLFGLFLTGDIMCPEDFHLLLKDKNLKCTTLFLQIGYCHVLKTYVLGQF